MMSRQEIVEQLKTGVFNVTFTKLDGTERVMPCTLDEQLMPPAKKDDPLTQKKVRELNENVLIVYCTDKQAFRSFRVNNVKRIEAVNV